MYECREVSEERRKSLFDHFHSLNLQGKKEWIVHITEKKSVKRRRLDKGTGEEKVPRDRNVNYHYLINKGEGSMQVCINFLVNTLDITRKFIYYTLSNMENSSAKEDMRGRHNRGKRTDESLVKSAQDFIKNLPAVPSHYCRKKVNKLYLDSELESVSNLYRVYTEARKKDGHEVVPEAKFREIFKSFNLGFHLPKKDKCLKCTVFDRKRDHHEVLGEEETIELEIHVREKEYTYNRFLAHQKIHQKTNDTLCCSFDLQKVLTVPHGKSIHYYYVRKYAVYNFTIYESGSSRGINHVWGEADGKRGGNEIATILRNYLLRIDQEGKHKNILMYCDNCAGQNKNRTVFAMIYHTLKECVNIKAIQINYLMVGHSYMPVDSVHSTIEKKTKNCDIQSLTEWLALIKMTRMNPFPYECIRLQHTVFLEWKEITNFYFPKQVKKYDSGEPFKISQVCTVTFKNNKNTVDMKDSMLPDAKIRQITLTEDTYQSKIKNIYSKRLPIAAVKYNDLKKLCDKDIIAEHFKGELLTLPHSTGVRECLPETDEEDDKPDDG
uniref:DUF7869 domain-containing protein n=1 Tax=Cacopsylla melanoneura TaxID=428564 RepID=A0A8D8X766_9HEMI